MFTLFCDLVLFVLVSGLIVYIVLAVKTMRREMKAAEESSLDTATNDVVL